MMNCNNYRDAIAADPSQSFDGATHADECQACLIFRDEMLTLDNNILRALRVDTPELSMPELPNLDAVDTKVANLPFKGRVSRPVWIGLAASIVLATVLGVQFLTKPVIYPSLGAEIIAHLDHEPRAVRVIDKAVSHRRLAKAINADVETMDTDLGLITYARTCVINGKKIPHLVMQGVLGPITLLLLPDEMVDSPVSLQGEGIEGVILPVGDGSVAVIGERGESLDKVKQNLRNSVKWRT